MLQVVDRKCRDDWTAGMCLRQLEAINSYKDVGRALSHNDGMSGHCEMPGRRINDFHSLGNNVCNDVEGMRGSYNSIYSKCAAHSGIFWTFHCFGISHMRSIT